MDLAIVHEVVTCAVEGTTGTPAIMGADMGGMPGRTAGSGAGIPARTVGSRTVAGMLAIITEGFKTGAGTPATAAGIGAGIATLAGKTAGTGEGMPARKAGSGVGMPARTVGSRTLGIGVTGGRGREVADKVERGSGTGEVAIISVGVSDRLGDAMVPTSVGGVVPAAVPNIGTSGCNGWLGVPVTTVGVALIMGVAAAVGVSATVDDGAGAVGGT